MYISGNLTYCMGLQLFVPHYTNESHNSDICPASHYKSRSSQGERPAAEGGLSSDTAIVFGSREGVNIREGLRSCDGNCFMQHFLWENLGACLEEAELKAGGCFSLLHTVPRAPNLTCHPMTWEGWALLVQTWYKMAFCVTGTFASALMNHAFRFVLSNHSRSISILLFAFLCCLEIHVQSVLGKDSLPWLCESTSFPCGL